MEFHFIRGAASVARASGLNLDQLHLVRGDASENTVRGLCYGELSKLGCFLFLGKAMRRALFHLKQGYIVHYKRNYKTREIAVPKK
jgi:hypothetical protein